MDECHHATGKHPYACIMTVSIISSPSFSLNYAVLNFLLIFIIIIYLSSDFFINMLYYTFNHYIDLKDFILLGNTMSDKDLWKRAKGVNPLPPG